MSAAHSSELDEVNKRLKTLEMMVTNLQTKEMTDKLETVLDIVRESAEGNTYGNITCYNSLLFIFILLLLRLKMTVMDRLVAELGGIETAIVTLQDQVICLKCNK